RHRQTTDKRPITRTISTTPNRSHLDNDRSRPIAAPMCCSEVDAGIELVQWNDAKSWQLDLKRGHVEFEVEELHALRGEVVQPMAGELTEPDQCGTAVAGDQMLHLGLEVSVMASQHDVRCTRCERLKRSFDPDVDNLLRRASG